MDEGLITCKCILFTSISSNLNFFNKFRFTYKTVVNSIFIIPIRFMGTSRNFNGFIVCFNWNTVFNNLLSNWNHCADYWYYSSITRWGMELSYCRSFRLNIKTTNWLSSPKEDSQFFYMFIWLKRNKEWNKWNDMDVLFAKKTNRFYN